MLKLAFCIANVTCTHAPLVCIFIKLYILCFVVFGLLNCRNMPWPLVVASLPFIFCSIQICCFSFGGRKWKYTIWTYQTGCSYNSIVAIGTQQITGMELSRVHSGGLLSMVKLRKERILQVTLLKTSITVIDNWLNWNTFRSKCRHD